MIIHLGAGSPPPSSNLPESFSRAGLKRFPIWSCSAWGLPSHRRRRRCWCALTAPFHPYRSDHEAPAAVTQSGILPAVYSLLHFPSRLRAWGLPSTLPCGVRTFLPGRTVLPGHPRRSPDRLQRRGKYTAFGRRNPAGSIGRDLQAGQERSKNRDREGAAA